MILEGIVVGPLQVNCYVIGCETTRQALVIDPGDDVDAILSTLERQKLALVHILATHAHFDHVLAVGVLQERTGAPFSLHPADRPLLAMAPSFARAWLGLESDALPQVHGDLLSGQIVVAGEIKLEVRPTPGHSPGGITLVEHQSRWAFTGDAIFAGSVGRTDLPGGDHGRLIASIREQILTLPDDFSILPGHGPESTVGRERLANPFLQLPAR